MCLPEIQEITTWIEREGRTMLLVQSVDDLRAVPVGSDVRQPYIRKFCQEWPRIGAETVWIQQIRYEVHQYGHDEQSGGDHLEVDNLEDRVHHHGQFQRGSVPFTASLYKTGDMSSDLARRSTSSVPVF